MLAEEIIKQNKSAGGNHDHKDNVLMIMPEKEFKKLLVMDTYPIRYDEGQAAILYECGRRDGLIWARTASAGNLKEAIERKQGSEMINIYFNDHHKATVELFGPGWFEKRLQKGIDFSLDDLCDAIISNCDTSFVVIVTQFNSHGFKWLDFGKNLMQSNYQFWVYENGWMSSVHKLWNDLH